MFKRKNRSHIRHISIKKDNMGYINRNRPRKDKTKIKAITISILCFLLIGSILFGSFYLLDYTKNQYRNSGIEKFANADYEGSIENFQKSLDIKCLFEENIDNDTKYYLGEAYFKLGEYENAVFYYESLINKNYKIEDAQIYRAYAKAMIYMEAKQYNEAILQLEEIKDCGINNIYTYLGACYFEIEDNENAIINLKMAIENNENEKAFNYSMLMTIALNNRDMENAAVYVLEGLKLPDNKYTKYFCFGDVILCEYNGQYTEAHNKAKDYLISYPDYEELYKEFVFLETRI